MNTARRVLAMTLVLAIALSLVACGPSAENNTALSGQLSVQHLVNGPVAGKTDGNQFDEVSATVGATSPAAGTVTSNLREPKGEYNKGVVLVKVKETFAAADVGTLAYTAAEPLYTGSKWYAIRLADTEKTEEAVAYLAERNTFEMVDYDYIMGVATDGQAKVTDNPNYDKQTNLGLSNIPNGWTHNGKAPGGSPDVIVAVIDTGVDYNHLDLRNNIWVNSAEIPGNGIDDDGNGYVDDIRGWNCVGDNNDPMDDNGHGTHVAGIVAAENNKIGGIGVAYNCKIMVLKAGNSSGYFNNSDIAEAVRYAYMNGASVINMSFGGSSISVAVEEALENAYNSCVLVAAAGNNGACNNLSCRECKVKTVSYPAALPYVIGVMSTIQKGTFVSDFSNYDHNPYDSIEYEVYAVGQGVVSTWPSNKYSCLSGTSMAAPTVAGIAALLRSHYTDREMYSTKFIQSQIVNTGKVHPSYQWIGGNDKAHSVADAYEALTKLPKPSVNLYDYYVDDGTTISMNNNGNGVIDAGETVRLYFSLHNRGGVASNVNVSIDTYRGEIGDDVLTDPYFTFVNYTMQLSDIGTYSVRESGDKYFEIIVSPDCPNDYLTDFNIRFTYENGLDDKDETVYNGEGVAQFSISRGFLLPTTIAQDTVYKADKLYIVGGDVIIPKGVTVTFEAGCEIRFYDGRAYYNSPVIKVYGTLIFNGTPDKMVRIAPREQNTDFVCWIFLEGNAELICNYLESTNLSIDNGLTTSDYGAVVNNSFLRRSSTSIYTYEGGSVTGLFSFNLYIKECKNSYLELHAFINQGSFSFRKMQNCYVHVLSKGKNFYIHSQSEFVNNIVYSEEVNRTGIGTPISLADATVFNNAFLSSGDDINSLKNLSFSNSTVSDNLFSKAYQENASQIIYNYYDAYGNPTVDVYSSLSDASLLWPHVVSIELFDKDGNPITTVGKEEIKVRVTFNRPMDTTKDTFLTFGTVVPYADYTINGEYISDTVWEGTYTLKAQIENGQNFLKVNNACAAEDPTKTVFGKYHLHEFTIDTTAAMSMNLLANPKDNGIELTFAQDDYDTLLGYNIYRADSKDGNYVKLNPAILLPDENTFLDENAEPGKTYWYTYTVVLTDFSESNPAGKVTATAMDTMLPHLYHTPVNQGYENNNLVISCIANDNVAVATVTLYYRTVGAAEWKTLAMSKQSDKYSATIFGSEVTLSGIEYYIVASDGRNTIAKGSAEAPYTVVVKEASSLSRKGDVDGDGVVTAKDALMLMQCLEGKLILSDDRFKRADLNNDGVLSAAEALLILQYVNGKINTLEL